jgi:hypothetical protein
VADTAIIDEVSKIDRSCRAASVLSCVQTELIDSHVGRLDGCSRRASSRSALHSERSPAMSSGGVLMVEASRDDVRSRPSSI